MKGSSRISYFFRPVFWASIFMVFSFAVAACAPAATAVPTAVPVVPTSAPVVAPTTAAVPVTGSEAQINVVNDPKLGQILVGNNGMTLYVFGKDTPDKSNCSAGCLKSWPPLVTQGNPTLGAGVDASMVSSTSLPDGSKVVTYNHMPLYYFAKDTKPGDTNGQGVGNIWFTVTPDGKPVGQGSSPSAAPTTASTSSAQAASGAVINIVTDAKLGKILVGANGMTLYAFTKDTADKSNCNAGCMQNWPPLTAQAAPTLGAGVDASMVGSTTLADGSKIVTYNHMPLYYFAKDTKAGDTNGQGVGSVWFAVTPDGKLAGQSSSNSAY